MLYHDIIGDCMENERDEKQVVRIIHDEDDLDMLFAISQADGKAICGL